MSAADGLRHKVAIVTGAGQGIGRGEALELARCGAKVVVNDLDADLAAAVVDEILTAGGEATAVTASVSSPEGGRAITSAALDAFGSVDILINNAGFMRPAAFEDLTSRQIEEVVGVHLLGAFYATQPAWRVMKAQGYGRIVLTGSSAGMFGQGANSNYCAAKAGVYGLARALAYEGAAYGIGVNTVLPFASTDIGRRDPVPGVQQQRERAGATYTGDIAERRGIDTVAPLVAFLCSASCVSTGQVFSACGGRYARIAVDVNDGWLAPDHAAMTLAQVEAHWPEITGGPHRHEPADLFEEVRLVVHALARQSASRRASEPAPF